MKLHRQLENTRWIDCSDRTDYFIGEVVKLGVYDFKLRERAFPTRDEIIARLKHGETLKFDNEYWYAEIRDEDAHAQLIAQRAANRKPVEMKKCSCGHTVPISQVMSASLGTSCPDCYDRMSN